MDGPVASHGSKGAACGAARLSKANKPAITTSPRVAMTVCAAWPRQCGAPHDLGGAWAALGEFAPSAAQGAAPGVRRKARNEAWI